MPYQDRPPAVYYMVGDQEESTSSVAATPHRNPVDRPRLIDELYVRYGRRSGSGWWRVRSWWKRNAWRVVTGGTRALKRFIDLAGAVAGLVILSPVFAAVALAIKLTDGGPVFHMQTRVGRWGREFPFPKFRPWS